MCELITSFSLENSITVIPRLLPAAKDELTNVREVIKAREIEPTNILLWPILLILQAKRFKALCGHGLSSLRL